MPPPGELTPFDKEPGDDFLEPESPISSSSIDSGGITGDGTGDGTGDIHARSRRSVFWPWLIVLAVLLGGTFSAYAWWQKREREQLDRWRWGLKSMPERVARVPEEWSAKTLAERLQESGKVNDATAFEEAAQKIGLEIVEPGAYPLPEKAGPRELAQIFNQPAPLVKVTFPEGWTANRMAKRLESEKFENVREFRQMVYPPGTPISPLEGKLFPETYYLPYKGTAKELAAPMLERYREITEQLPRPFPLAAKDRPLSLQEVTILASLVERETHVAAERPVIAGVLLNRLRKGMRLQCDASVQYARERAAAAGELSEGHKERLLFRDLEIKSPYNTYENAGLPPGPICNPGEDSLRAAAAPKQTEYFFYVMSPKLNRHRFAKTFAEHERNVRLYHQERRAR